MEENLVVMECRKSFEETICDKRSNLVVPYLEDNIIFEIFRGICACKINKLRYDCKQWYNLFSSSYFIDGHLRQSKLGLMAIPTSLPLHRKWGAMHVDPDFVHVTNEKVSIRSLSITRKNFVRGTCNGLVLLEDICATGNLSIANPATGQLLKLPPCTQRSKKVDIVRGITYFDCSGEYKIISVVIHKTGWFGCEMLALGSSAWKWVASPFECVGKWSLSERGCVSIKGVFHIMLFSIRGSVHTLSFDTVEEKFYKSEFQNNCLLRVEVLHEIEGCPSVVVPNFWVRGCQFDIWVLKDLCTGEWDKRYTISLTIYRDKFSGKLDFPYIVGVLKNGRFLILKRDSLWGKYYSYDVQRHQLKFLNLDERLEYVFRPHVESLVSCRRP